MIFYWTAILAISTLLYVLLDGLDLGVGIISGGAGSHARRDAMMNAIAPIWDGNVHGAAIGGPAPSAKPCNRAIRSAISSRGKSTSREALLPWLSGALSRHRSPLARWRRPAYRRASVTLTPPRGGSQYAIGFAVLEWRTGRPERQTSDGPNRAVLRQCV
jgi:hypothetical protein